MCVRWPDEVVASSVGAGHGVGRLLLVVFHRAFYVCRVHFLGGSAPVVDAEMSCVSQGRESFL